MLLNFKSLTKVKAICRWFSLRPAPSNTWNANTVSGIFILKTVISWLRFSNSNKYSFIDICGNFFKLMNFLYVLYAFSATSS